MDLFAGENPIFRLRIGGFTSPSQQFRSGELINWHRPPGRLGLALSDDAIHNGCWRNSGLRGEGSAPLVVAGWSSASPLRGFATSQPATTTTERRKGRSSNDYREI